MPHSAIQKQFLSKCPPIQYKIQIPMILSIYYRLYFTTRNTIFVAAKFKAYSANSSNEINITILSFITHNNYELNNLYTILYLSVIYIFFLFKILLILYINQFLMFSSRLYVLNILFQIYSFFMIIYFVFVIHKI